jgi:hemerythrin
MALFVWNDRVFSVHVAQFDAHHKNLLQMINDLHDAMVQKAGSSVIDGVVARLVEYTKYHFTEEERLMKELGFPGCEAHRAEHQTFVAKTLELEGKLKKGEMDLSVQTMKFLLDWLKSHIRGTDRLYTRFFNERNVS